MNKYILLGLFCLSCGPGALYNPHGVSGASQYDEHQYYGNPTYGEPLPTRQPNTYCPSGQTYYPCTGCISNYSIKPNC